MSAAGEATGMHDDGAATASSLLDGLSARATWLYGLLLAALLALALVALLAQDRAGRLAAADEQVSALAVATRGLAYFALRDAERALLRVAGAESRRRAAGPAGPASPPPIADLLSGHAELSDVRVVDGGDAGIAAWSVAGQPGMSAMRFGPPRRDVSGAWVLPLAVALPAGAPGWVVGHYRLQALQQVVMRLQDGAPVLITILDRDRHVLARTMDPESSVGRVLPDPVLARRLAQGVDSLVDHHRHPDDGVWRIRAYQTSAYYPLVVGTGLPRAGVLLPWHVLVALGVLGYGLFWAGFLHLLRIVRRSDARQARMLGELRRSGELLAFALRAGQMGAWAMRSDGTLWWSDEVPALHGLAHGDAVAEDALLSRLHPGDLDRVVAALAALRGRGEDLSLDYRVIAQDGSVRYLSSRGARIAAPGSDILTSGVVTDVTHRVAAEQRLLDAERQFRLMFERNPLPFWVFDVETLRFLEVNEAAIASYGYSRDEFLSMTLHDIRPPAESPRLLADLAERATTKEPGIWIHRRKDGSDIEARIHAADIEFSGRPARLVLAEDVSERRRAERELRFRASHDLLTGLPNAAAFAQHLQALIADADGPVHVVRVALQRHALVSDSLGAAVGDEVLLRAAVRLRQAVAAPGLVARMQGAEFILATLPAEGDPDGALLLDALSAVLREPVWAADAPHYLDATFGHAMHPHDGTSAETLVRNAGLAAHHVVQRQCTDRVRYSAGLGRQMSSRLAMLARLHQAIEREDFELHFQPIFGLGDGGVCGYEALARWPQADGSYIPPGDFIPLCEDSALIVPLGRWVLREAALAWHRLAADGQPQRTIAVNISVTQFTRSDLVAELRDVIDTHRLPPGAIELELTEGVVMSDPEQVIRTLGELRAMGVRLAIDDFGTGYSNMAYLRRLPVHTLKIDRMFVHDVVADPHNAAICRSIISLAALFGIEVTAEGVETVDQLDWLRANGAHKAQGYLLGRPRPLASRAGPVRAMPGAPG